MAADAVDDARDDEGGDPVGDDRADPDVTDYPGRKDTVLMYYVKL